jgi:hypothetical protein
MSRPPLSCAAQLFIRPNQIPTALHVLATAFHTWGRGPDTQNSTACSIAHHGSPRAPSPAPTSNDDNPDRPSKCNSHCSYKQNLKDELYVCIHCIPYSLGICLSTDFSACQTKCVPHSNVRHDLKYPLSFRVPLSQVAEIDEAVIAERRKRRSDLLEVIWQVAWSSYKRSGSLHAYAEGRRAPRHTKRVSEELQDQLYTALETILERAPSAVIEEVARKLTHWAGKYGDEK